MDPGEDEHLRTEGRERTQARRPSPEKEETRGAKKNSFRKECSSVRSDKEERSRKIKTE